MLNDDSIAGRLPHSLHVYRGGHTPQRSTDLVKATPHNALQSLVVTTCRQLCFGSATSSPRNEVSHTVLATLLALDWLDVYAISVQKAFVLIITSNRSNQRVHHYVWPSSCWHFWGVCADWSVTFWRVCADWSTVCAVCFPLAEIEHAIKFCDVLSTRGRKIWWHATMMWFQPHDKIASWKTSCGLDLIYIFSSR